MIKHLDELLIQSSENVIIMDGGMGTTDPAGLYRHRDTGGV